MVKVSVILTTYNTGPRLCDTLAAVLGQNGAGTEFDLELFAVDDCSTDATPMILREFGIDHICLPENSGGPNKGRNIGLGKATGDYICLLDHDDIWHPDKIRLQLAAARLAPIISTGYKIRGQASGKELLNGNDDGIDQVYGKGETFISRLTRNNNSQLCCLSTIMFHRSLALIRFEENFGMLDYDWLLRLFENQASVQVGRILMTRLVDGHNLSLVTDYRRSEFYYSLMTLENYDKVYPREVKLAFQRIHGTRARYHYLKGEMKSARRYLRKSSLNLVSLLYYLTSYAGSRWVQRNFRVFG